MKAVIGGIKGGTGKTLAATNLVAMLHLAGRKVLLVDADDQASAAEFCDQRAQLGRGTLRCVRLSGAAVREQVRVLAADFDDVIIDTGGRDTASQRAALSVADVVLLPFQPGNFDLWTLDKVLSLLGEIRAVNPGLRALAYVSRGLPSGTDNADARALLAEADGIDLLDVTIGNRKAFNAAAGEGLSIVELPGRSADAKGAAEMLALYRGLFGVEWTRLQEAVPTR